MKKFVILIFALCVISCGSKTGKSTNDLESEVYSEEYQDSSSYSTPSTYEDTESQRYSESVNAGVSQDTIKSDASSTPPVEVSHTNEEGYSGTMRDKGDGTMDYHDNTGYSVNSVDNGSSVTVTDNEGNSYTIDY